MKSSGSKGFFGNLASDLPASVVVFLVALPLCLGIALASGAPLFAGVIAGIIGGIVVGLLSGSPLGVSGPAAGLAVIVLNAIKDLGAYETFLLAVVLGGVFQILLGVARAGIIGYYFPNSVIKGMLSGIGIIIVLKQIPHAFGYDKDPIGDEEFLQMDGHNSFSDLFYMLDYITPGAVVITLVSMTVLILWEQKFMQKISVLKLIPGPLVAVISGILLNIAFQSNATFLLDPEHLVSIPVAGSWDDFIGLFTTPDFTQISNPDIYLVAFTIAVVASLETLLCVEATDKLDPQKRITPTNRELLAQGAGNMISGLIGGLPITQVIVRSSANIQSGGKSKAAAVFHGFLLLICALSIPQILNLIPLASLASILFMVGYKLAKPSLFKEMYGKGMGQFIPFVVTILGIVFTDLLIGISLGLVVGVFQILRNNFSSPYRFDTEEHVPGEFIKIHLAEDVSFLNKARVLNTLSKIPDNTKVIINAQKTRSIHPDVVEIIEDFELNAKTRNIELEVIGLYEDFNENPVQDFEHHVVNKKPTKAPDPVKD